MNDAMNQDLSSTTTGRSGYTINTYSYTQRYSALECLQKLSDRGYRSFELMMVPGHFWPSLSDRNGRDAISRLLASRHLKIEIINQPALDINLSSSVPEMRQHSCSMITYALELAAECGAEAVVINPGKANPVFTPPTESLHEWFSRSLDSIMKSARQYNVQILVKNHPLSFLYRSDDLVTFFDSYGWDRIVLGYDFANGYFGKEDPLVALANLTGRLGVVYAADTTLDDFQHAVVGTGAVRFAEVAQALREQQYSGPTVLEIVSQAPDESIDKSVAYLDNVNWPTRPR